VAFNSFEILIYTKDVIVQARFHLKMKTQKRFDVLAIFTQTMKIGAQYNMPPLIFTVWRE